MSETHDQRYTRAHAILRKQLPEVDSVRLSMALDLVFDAVAAEQQGTMAVKPAVDLYQEMNHAFLERAVEIEALKTELSHWKGEADRLAELEARLPWKEATVRFLECDVGHGRLTADNWMPEECPHCRIAHLESVIANMPNAQSVEEMLDAKDARIAELKSALASQAKSETTGDMKAPAPPKEFPAGALKGPTGDPRRIGR